MDYNVLPLQPNYKKRGCYKSPFSRKGAKKNAKSAKFLILIINYLRSLHKTLCDLCLI
ncbi:MAG: hypothetical protein LBS50_00420 [Prevotellaceae bacterium]|jgi:hypothetical protein|nr:hypothetical protein [Prevotellaceae bacterium]